MTKKREALFLDIEHRNALEEISQIKKLGELNSVSKLVRYIILDYYDMITKSTSPDVRLNAMSKELSMVLNLVSTIVHQASTPHEKNEKILQFYEAERYVEHQINENKTNKKRGIHKKEELEIKKQLAEKIYEQDTSQDSRVIKSESSKDHHKNDYLERLKNRVGNYS